MTNHQRFESILKNHRLPDDRLPVIEWSVWWDKTIERWENEGLPKGLDTQQIFQYFDLDEHVQFWVRGVREGVDSFQLSTEEEYEAVMDDLYCDENIDKFMAKAKEVSERSESEKPLISLLIDGFFWHPRNIFGIEEHLYAFYDNPELMHRINKDQLEYSKKVIDRFCAVLKPDILCIAEDMSYNLGSMISKELYDEFMAPYYRELIPYAKSKGMTVFLDTDGYVEPLIPWFKEVGIEGVTPLERKAGVDVCRILEEHPDFLTMGAFDKLTMHLGESAMRAEFERILPAMRTGRYIVSVDHQTPPGVSIENYRIYLALLREYCERAVKAD